jgi:hypothetical protein
MARRLDFSQIFGGAIFDSTGIGSAGAALAIQLNIGSPSRTRRILLRRFSITSLLDPQTSL